MMHILQPGDKVAFLDEKGSGVVVSVNSTLAVVRMDNGLEIPFPLNQLVWYTAFTEGEFRAIHPEEPVPVKKPESQPKKSTTSENREWDQAKPVIRKVKDKSFTVDPRLIGEKQPRKKKVARDDTWELDLHIEELTDDHSRLSNGEILEIQLRHFRSFLWAAREKKVRRLIVIHGVGTGRLRGELNALLLHQDDLEVFDAPYKDYGQGAMEIRLYYAGKKG